MENNLDKFMLIKKKRFHQRNISSRFLWTFITSSEFRQRSLHSSLSAFIPRISLFHSHFRYQSNCPWFSHHARETALCAFISLFCVLFCFTQARNTQDNNNIADIRCPTKLSQQSFRLLWKPSIVTLVFLGRSLYNHDQLKIIILPIIFFALPAIILFWKINFPLLYCDCTRF